MNRRRMLAFVLGAAALAALTVYAGFQPILRCLTELGAQGLLVIVLLHLPIVGLLGIAWWLVGRDLPGATAGKFAWARLVRDAAAEVLPFSQLGGFVLGVRALNLNGIETLRGTLSMSVDLVLELWAKLPYFLAGLAALALIRDAAQLRALPVALALTALCAALPVFFRKRLGRLFGRMAAGLSRRWPDLGDPDEAARYFTRVLARSRVLLAAFAVHFACWCLGGVETWVMLRLMGVTATVPAAVAIDSLANGLRTFGFLVPAAAGVQEGAYVLACAMFGLSPATAIALSLARRARDIALGVPALAAWQAHEARHGLRADQNR